MLATILSCLIAYAPAAADTPADTVDRMHRQLHEDMSAGAAKSKLAKTVDKAFDFAELARLSLGNDAAKLTAAEMSRVAKSLQAIITANYIPKLRDTSPNAMQIGNTEVNEDHAVVHTQGSDKDKQIPIDFKLHKRAGGWAIYDVSIDSVSLVDTYTEQFARMMARDGKVGLLAKLDEKRQAVERAGP